MSQLYNCKTCKKLVAMDAKTCPHCGTGSPVRAFVIAKLIAIIILIGVFVLFNKQIQHIFFWIWGKTLF